MSTADVLRAARRHKQTTSELSSAALIRSAKAWNRVHTASIVSSWQALAVSAVAAVNVAQSRAMESGDAFTQFAFEDQGLDFPVQAFDASAVVGTMPASAVALDAAFAGVAYHALDRISLGVAPVMAMRSGLVELTQLIETAVADAPRAQSAVRIGTATQRVVYTRMVSAKCCARCAVLAGRTYEWNRGFLRHPRCRCVHIPTAEVGDADFTTDPYQAFESLSRADQDRIYTKAGAEAIRNGGDINQIVNSRRGMSANGRFTNEGTGRRGFYKNSTTAGKAGHQRLSVDEIMRRANGDKDRFEKMLTDYGYITDYGQVAEGALRGDVEGFGQMGRGGARVGAASDVREARRTGVRRVGARATMTAAERRAFDAMSPAQMREFIRNGGR